MEFRPIIKIQKINEVSCRIFAEASVCKEINDKFRYRAPNYFFDKRIRKGKWDGYTKLYNMVDNTFPIGILPELSKFLEESGYQFTISGDFGAVNFSEYEALEFIKTLNLPEKYSIRDYQLKYFIKAVRNRRMIGLSPTSSGKSLIIYLLYRYFKVKTLIIVPTTALVLQFINDFKDYGYEGDAHLIMEGNEKDTKKDLIISTYQAIYDENQIWFADKELIIVDEVHTFQAKTLVKMMKKTKLTKIKIGFTGSLQEDELSLMNIKSSFGPIYRFIRSHELIEKGFSSPVYFKILKLNHINSLYRNNEVKINYHDEINYIEKLDNRAEFIKNLAISLTGNTFIMFRTKQHGKKLFDLIKKESKVPVFYVDGSVDATDRLDLIKEIEEMENSITVCSTVFSTGINLQKLNNLIFSHPSKSRIRVIQSIGRGLRMKLGKKYLMVFDIADILIDRLDNTTLLHLKERKKMYDEEKFPYKEYNINLA